MRRYVIRLGAVVLGTGTGLAAAAGAAGAASSASLPGIQAEAAAAITLRVNDLNAAIAKVNAAEDLGAGQSTLAAYLARDIAPLQQLGTKVAGDSSVGIAEADYQQIFTDFRVLALVLPAAGQAADADHVMATAVPALTANSSKAQSHLDPTNQAVLQPMIDALNADITSATNAASGLASTVLSFVPSQWNANRSLLSPTQANLATANTAVKDGRAEVQQIKQYLEHTRPTAGTVPTSPPPTPGG